MFSIGIGLITGCIIGNLIRRKKENTILSIVLIIIGIIMILI